MDIEKLFKLIDAGFTKDEIFKLVSTTDSTTDSTIVSTTVPTTTAAVSTTEAAVPTTDAAVPTTAPAKPEAPAAAPAKPIESSPAWAEQLIRSNENLTAAIKSINLLNSSVPAPAGDDITQVFASIIDPEGSAMKERK